MKETQLEILDSEATPGEWGRFAPLRGPWKERATQAFRDKKYDTIDTSHHMSAMLGDSPYRIAQFTHATDAALSEVLVNAFRAGELIQTSKMGSVTRVEVIDGNGRAYVTEKSADVSLSFQDDGHTLKIFLKKTPEKTFKTGLDLTTPPPYIGVVKQ